MTDPKSPRPRGTILSTLRRALSRAMLGKASDDYMEQFTNPDGWCDRVTAADPGGPEQRPWGPAPGVPVAPAFVPDPAGSECEPVHGWTRRQFEEYFRRNPGYIPAYEAARRHRSGGR